MEAVKMQLNGIEISFDMDIRTDYDRFTKAVALMQKKRENNKGKFEADDMVNFLTGCIKKNELEEVLADGRMSTLVKVFTEFFKYAIDQIELVHGIYKEAAEAVVDAQDKMASLQFDYSGMVPLQEQKG